MAQQKALGVLAGLAHDPHRGRPCPDKVAHRLMRRVRHPDRRQFSSSMRVASITASRRSVFTRSPAFIGIRDGATTM